MKTKSAKSFIGMKWKARINGKRAMNGARYGVTVNGTVEDQGDGNSIYDVLHCLTDHLEEINSEMQIQDSIQIVLWPVEQDPRPTAGSKLAPSP